MWWKNVKPPIFRTHPIEAMTLADSLHIKQVCTGKDWKEGAICLRSSRPVTGFHYSGDSGTGGVSVYGLVSSWLRAYRGRDLAAEDAMGENESARAVRETNCNKLLEN